MTDLITKGLTYFDYIFELCLCFMLPEGEN